MSRRRYRDNLDIDALMSSIARENRATSPKPKAKRHININVLGKTKKLATQAKQTAKRIKDDTVERVESRNRHYVINALGMPEKVKPTPIVDATKAKKHAKSAGRKLAANRRALFKLLALAAVIALFLAIPTIYNYIRSRNQPAKDPHNITPSQVFVPKQLPAEFSLAAESQQLTNGAVVFDAYGPDGEVITITQHAQDPDYTQPVIPDASQSFAVNGGQGYIVEADNRITGFLLLADTWILFNSTDDLDTAELTALMHAFAN